MIKKIFKYTLFLLPLLFPILVRADTTIDTANWINVTGVKWSETGLFYSGNPTYNNDWLLNNYYIYSGTFVNNGADWNYIEFSYFEHSGGTFNPCNSTSKFTADFSLLFTSPGIVDQVWQVKWGNDNCAMTSKNSQTGVIELSCGASPSTGQQTDIFVYYSDSIFQQNQSYVYISRDIGITCGLNTDAIINNDNANTQNIINNNNQNTQQIIDSSSSNTQAIIESNKVCSSYDLTNTIENKTLDANGNAVDNSTTNVSNYIKLSTSDELYLLQKTNTIQANYCFYNTNKTKISCYSSRNQEIGKLTIPDNTSYFRYTIHKSQNLPTYKICKNGNQALDDSINNLDDTLNDDDTSGATSEASDFFSDFTTNTFGLTSIITAPLSLIQSLLSSSCSDLELPLPYLNNKKLTLPCMSTIYSTYFGTFFSLYQTITYGIVAYWVCVRIFNLVKDFKNPEHDEIEVVDL